MKKRTAIVIVFLGLLSICFLSCQKDDSDDLGDVMWTEVHGEEFRYLGVSREKEVVAVKMNNSNTIPTEIFYKQGNNPALHIWLDDQGMPEKAMVDDVLMMFQNIRPNLIDVGVLYQGQIEILRDIEFDHEFLQYKLKTLKEGLGLDNTLSWVGVVVDGVGCIGGVAGAKFTGGASLILSKLTCKGFIAGITKKTIVKAVDNEIFTEGVNTWGLMEVIASADTPSPGGVISGIGSIIWGYNHYINNNEENINLLAGILQGGHGDIQVTLTWNSVCDLDLWVTDPYGETIKWNNSTSASGGFLDYDNTYAYGPENVFWSAGDAPSGTYQVRVDYFSGSGTSTYSVLIIVGDQVLNNGQPFTGQISPNQTIHVTNFSYGTKSDLIKFEEINRVENSKLNTEKFFKKIHTW